MSDELQVIFRLNDGNDVLEVVVDPSFEGEKQFGEYDGFPRPRVRVAPGLPTKLLFRTVLHEMLHHFEGETGHNLGESKVRGLEDFLTRWMRHDPEFWLALVESQVEQKKEQA